jgi:hypothetical protein
LKNELPDPSVLLPIILVHAVNNIIASGGFLRLTDPPEAAGITTDYYPKI